jgi:positive regulator of sigma E activity
MRYAYGLDWIPGGVLLGTVLLLLIVPPLALIALVVVAVAAAAALVALAGAVLAMPFLLVRAVRRRLAERPVRQPQPLKLEGVYGAGPLEAADRA